MPLTPKNRKEEWLQGLVDHETTLTPKNRPEEWMKEIIDASGGGGGGVLKVGITFEGQTATMDKTWAEINEAFSNGIVFSDVYPQYEETGKALWLMCMVYSSGGSYNVGALYMNGMTPYMFTTNSENGYPVCEQG